MERNAQADARGDTTASWLPLNVLALETGQCNRHAGDQHRPAPPIQAGVVQW